MPVVDNCTDEGSVHGCVSHFNESQEEGKWRNKLKTTVFFSLPPNRRK